MDPDLAAGADQGRIPSQGGRSVSAQTVSGVVATGDRATVDARRVEVRRASAAPDITARLSNLPKPPVRLFVGRDEELARLRALMDTGRGMISQAVHGMGGVGKSELALQYAHAHRERYPLRWWVSCETEDTITASLADLTAQVNSDLVLTATPADAADWAVGWLQNRTQWLVILDNVEELSDIERLLGRLDSGHVLITTRRDLGWERLVDGCLKLESLDRAAAVRLLIEGAGQSDQLTAAVLADELGYLPLALQQAAGYLRQTRTPIATYLDRLRAQPDQVLNAIAEGDQAGRAVAQVWLETLDRLRSERPAAIETLRLLACFAPDDVPRTLLVDNPEREMAVEQALAVLGSYNLITLTDETVSTHRLLQWVVRAQARAEGDRDAARTDAWQQILDRAVLLLDHASPAGNPADAVEQWPEWTLLAPHTDALVDIVPDDSASPTFTHLMGLLAFFHWTQGRYEAALMLDRRVLAITEATRPEGHPNIALRLDNLAFTLAALGRLGEALPLRQRALRISEAALPRGHPDIALRLNNLASTLSDLGRSSEALPLQERALQISEAALPEGHPTIATRLDNLGSMLGDLGRLGEALPLQQRALRITEAALPGGHPDVALRLDNLAFTLAALGRLGEALPLRQRAVRISEAALPEGHPDIALRLNNLASTLSELGRLGEALPLQQRALRITEAALPEGHPDIALRLNNLAFTLDALGRSEEARPLRERARRVREAASRGGSEGLQAG